MDTTFATLASFILIAIGILLFSLFKSINNKSFIASDGSEFDNQSDLDVYYKLYENLIPLFSDIESKDLNQDIQGFTQLFLIKLTKEGFVDLKTLVKYRKQLKLLSDLINS